MLFHLSVITLVVTLVVSMGDFFLESKCNSQAQTHGFQLITQAAGISSSVKTTPVCGKPVVVLAKGGDFYGSTYEEKAIWRLRLPGKIQHENTGKK